MNSSDIATILGFPRSVGLLLLEPSEPEVLNGTFLIISGLQVHLLGFISTPRQEHGPKSQATAGLASLNTPVA
jgi:hypothetical protein